MAAINKLKIVLIEKKNNKQMGLAEWLENSENTISKWGSNKVQLSLEILFIVVKILKVNIGADMVERRYD